MRIRTFHMNISKNYRYRYNENKIYNVKEPLEINFNEQGYILVQHVNASSVMQGTSKC